jgi:hypothetical protein
VALASSSVPGSSKPVGWEAKWSRHGSTNFYYELHRALYACLWLPAQSPRVLLEANTNREGTEMLRRVDDRLLSSLHKDLK